MSGDVTAIVPAGGIGKRFGATTNKAFCTLLGRPLLAWTIGALQASPWIGEIIPVIREADMQEALGLFESCGFSKVKRLAPGGKERQDSVYHGLKLVSRKSGVVLIHDGARPLVTAEIVAAALAGLEDFDGVVVAVPVKDTIKQAVTGTVGGGKAGVVGPPVVHKTMNRESLWAVQTPQVFRLETLLRAYDNAKSEGFTGTDDSSLVERIGGRVRIVAGSYENIKITTPEDILVAEQLLKTGRGRR